MIKNIKITTALFLLCIILLLPSCGKGVYRDSGFFCMDTVVTLQIDADDAESVGKKCRELLKELDGELSFYNSDGAVAGFNRGALSAEEQIRLIDELAEVSYSVTYMTDNCFNCCLGGLKQLWKASEERGEMPDDDEIKAGLEIVALNKEALRAAVTNGASVDFGGIGKGYACERLIGLMKESGARSGMVSFVSSVGVFGKTPDGDAWKIAVRSPDVQNEIIGHIELEEGYMSVSGSYERFYEIDGKKYCHIIDPRTGYPAESGLKSVVTVSDNGALSDALSTAVFVMGREKAEELWAADRSLKVLLITDGGELIMSPAMAEIFKKK